MTLISKLRWKSVPTNGHSTVFFEVILPQVIASSLYRKHSPDTYKNSLILILLNAYYVCKEKWKKQTTFIIMKMFLTFDIYDRRDGVYVRVH